LTLEASPKVERAAAILVRARHLIALVGAGISVESGIPPFRGPGGLWTRNGEPGNDQWQRFLEDPRAWWRARMAAGKAAQSSAWEQARPNPAHYALAELEAIGVLRHVVTQNIDNLHQEAGSRSITEFHGNRFKLRCIRCNARFERDAFALSPDEPPSCPDCGGIVKSDTVMFGEPIPPDAISRAFEEARAADCILIVGTSAVVYPAAELPLRVRQNGGSLVEVNPMETPLSRYCEAVLREPAGEVMPRLVEAVRRRRLPTHTEVIDDAC
jgi:NAD-dependent deacetylase